jgi:hypothetical protein
MHLMAPRTQGLSNNCCGGRDALISMRITAGRKTTASARYLCLSLKTSSSMFSMSFDRWLGAPAKLKQLTWQM